MRNLILGGNGTLGKALCNYLTEEAKEEAIPFGERGSIEDLRTCSLDLYSIDRVYFLAWDVGGYNYLFSPDTQIRQLEYNTALLSNVMPQLTEIPFVFVSSQLADNLSIAYGITKKLGEVWTSNLQRPVARLQNIFGGTPSKKPSHVIGDFILQAIRDGKIKMFTDGQEYRYFTHIDDISRSLHYLMNNRSSGIYNVSSPIATQISTIADIISKYTGCSIEYGSVKGKNYETKKMDEIPVSSKISLEEGIKRMVEEAKRLWA